MHQVATAGKNSPKELYFFLITSEVMR